jgi:hypothetical protein
MIAAKYNRTDLIALLLKAPGIMIDLRDSALGWTALFHAAAAGQEDPILALLKAGAMRNIVDCNGSTAADVAEAQGKAMATALLQADPLNVFIHDMAYAGKELLVTALLKQGCPPTFRDERQGKQTQTPLMAASEGGQYGVVRILLSCPGVREGIDARDTLGQTSLML